MNRETPCALASQHNCDKDYEMISENRCGVMNHVNNEQFQTASN